jgi:hypothetical protein
MLLTREEWQENPAIPIDSVMEAEMDLRVPEPPQIVQSPPPLHDVIDPPDSGEIEP